MENVKNIIDNISIKVENCTEEQLHVLVNGYKAARYIMLSACNLSKYNLSHKERILLIQIYNEMKNLYCIIRKRISAIHDIDPGFYFVV